MSNTSEEKSPSNRAQLAERIADKICEWQLAEIYGGEAKKDAIARGTPYRIGFSLARTLDGEVVVYSLTYILVRYKTQFRAMPNKDSPVFSSEEKTLDFLRLAFVERKFEQALKITRKK